MVTSDLGGGGEKNDLGGKGDDCRIGKLIPGDGEMGWENQHQQWSTFRAFAKGQGATLMSTAGFFVLFQPPTK